MENKSDRTWVWIFLALLAVVALGATAYALMASDESSQTRRTTQTAREMGMTEQEHANMDKSGDTLVSDSAERVITFTDDGFDNPSYAFSDGAVTVKNESSMDLQFSSDDHPTHRNHQELNMDVLGPGESGTFTPPGPGTYGFHDHINDQFEGTLTVR